MTDRTMGSGRQCGGIVTLFILISGGPRKIYQSSVSIFGSWIWFSFSISIASCRRGGLREKGCDISPASFPLQKWRWEEGIGLVESMYAFHEFPQLRPSTQIVTCNSDNSQVKEQDISKAYSMFRACPVWP